MSQVINTNVMSLNAQRNLSRTSGALAQSLARLSSGLRINSAKDDAAGLAISERFTTQIRGMNQAIRNANDGISLAQVAEGALQEVANNLQRIRELAVQARNATNSESDREALDAEVQQRIAEINRVATQTEFNGLKVLDGSFTQQTFQVGANFGQTISVESIAAATGEALGLEGGAFVTYTLEGEMTGAVADGEFSINGTNIGAANDAGELAAAINAAGAGVTATVIATTVKSGNITNTDDVTGLELAGETIDAALSGAGSAEEAARLLAAAINSKLEGAGKAHIVATAVDDTVVLTAENGANIEIGGTVANSGFTAGTRMGGVSLTSEVGIEIEGDASNAGLTGQVQRSEESYGAINVRNAQDADIVLRVIDKALTIVNSSRAALGAVQNRFESVVANLSTSVENLSASRSRILDTDFAAETAALTRAQVLQQAGVAMLAQANMMPQNVLALLR